MSSLLINEPPLMVLPGLASQIGLNEAIVLQQVHYWIRDQRHVIDGYSWAYNTVEEWNKQFPFWSNATIRRIVDSLVDKGLLLKRKLSDNRFDMTLWYTIDMDALARIGEQMHLLKMSKWDCSERANGAAQSEQITSTKITTKTTTETTRGLTASVLESDGLDADLANELLAHRKRKKALLTQRAWDGIKREAAKAGWTLQAAVAKLIERDWKGFEAEWVAPKRGGANSKQQEWDSVIAQFANGNRGNPDDPYTIDMEYV